MGCCADQKLYALVFVTLVYVSLSTQIFIALVVTLWTDDSRIITFLYTNELVLLAVITLIALILLIVFYCCKRLQENTCCNLLAIISQEFILTCFFVLMYHIVDEITKTIFVVGVIHVGVFCLLIGLCMMLCTIVRFYHDDLPSFYVMYSIAILFNTLVLVIEWFPLRDITTGYLKVPKWLSYVSMGNELFYGLSGALNIITTFLIVGLVLANANTKTHQLRIVETTTFVLFFAMTFTLNLMPRHKKCKCLSRIYCCK